MKKVKNIIFDLGGVLVDCNPEYVYLDVFKGDRKKMQWFFDEVCTFDSVSYTHLTLPTKA